MKSYKKVLILGATGTLGYTLFSELSKDTRYAVFGSVRDLDDVRKRYPLTFSKNTVVLPGVEKIKDVREVFKLIRPSFVINCIGIVKQSSQSKDTKMQIYVNALFPHILSDLCKQAEVRLVHFSTDCVFNGEKGSYQESDIANAYDVYGRTKFLGEVINKHSLTIRTSIIGHSLDKHYGLIDWFLLQSRKINGYTNVIYSGLPTVEIARVIGEFVLPNAKLHGVYHVSSKPISKYELLQLVARVYKKKLLVEPFDEVVSDRSLVSERFQKEAGYKAPGWPTLVKSMHQNYLENKYFITYE